MPPQSCPDTCTLFGIKTYMHVGVSVCAYTESSHGGNITLVACPLEGCCDVVCAQNEHQVVCEEDLWKFMFATVSCTTSWLLLLPSCPHCLLFSSTWFFCTLSLSVDANMFLVVFFSFSTFLSVLSPFQIPEQCRFISQQCYAFINTNKQPYTNMFLPERALDTNCHTSCLVDTHANTHTYWETASQSVLKLACQRDVILW